MTTTTRTISGILYLPNGGVAANAVIRVTSVANSLYGMTTRAYSDIVCDDTGAYSIDLVYGSHNFQVRYDSRFYDIGNAVVDGDTTADDLMTLIVTSQPVTGAMAIYLKELVDQAAAAAAAAAASAAEIDTDTFVARIGVAGGGPSGYNYYQIANLPKSPGSSISGLQCIVVGSGGYDSNTNMGAFYVQASTRSYTDGDAKVEVETLSKYIDTSVAFYTVNGDTYSELWMRCASYCYPPSVIKLAMKSGTWADSTSLTSTAPSNIISTIIPTDRTREFATVRDALSVAIERDLANKKYAASDFIYHGLHYDNAGTEIAVNQGISTIKSNTNSFRMGRNYGYSPAGTSRSACPVFNVAGMKMTLDNINNSTAAICNVVKLPAPPTGAVTYDSSDGTIVDYETATDSKYGDVASDVDEACARAFEGLVLNGDFRNGVDDWSVQTNVTTSTADNILTASASSGTNYNIYLNNASAITVTSGIEYTLEFYMKSTNGSGTTSPAIAIGSTSGGSDYASGTIDTPQDDWTKYTYTFTTTSTSLYAHITPNVTVYSEDVDFAGFSIKPSTVSVTTKRVDLVGFEFWPEEITADTPEVFPYGCIQSLATTIEGLATSASSRTQTYFSVYDGDTSTVGYGYDFYNATMAHRLTILANPDHNIIYDSENDKWYQWRCRQRAIAGGTDGDWSNVDTSGTSSLLSSGGLLWVAAQGENDSVTSLVVSSGSARYTYPSNTGNILGGTQDKGVFIPTTSVSYNGECYFYPVCTVPRLNQGAYHPKFNPFGASRWNNTTGYGSSWYVSTVNTPVYPAQAFITATSTSGAGTPLNQPLSGTLTTAESGRVDAKYCDVIYEYGEGGIIDERLKYGAWDASSAEQAATSFEEVKAATYRSRDHLHRTEIEYTAATETDASAVTMDVADYTDWSVGDTISIVLSGTVLISKAEITAVASGVVTWDEIDGTFSKVSATSYHVVHTFDTDVTLEANNTQMDVIGDPANLLLTPQLADGWCGDWIPVVPDGTSQVYPLSHKSATTSTVTAIYSSTYGDSWTSTTYASYSVTTNSVTSTIASAMVQLAIYKAYLNPTVKSENLSVLNGSAGVLTPLAGIGYHATRGSLLALSTLRVLTTNDVSPHTVQPCLMTNTLLSGAFVEDNDNYKPVHYTLTLGTPTNTYVGGKYLAHQVSINNQANLNIIANELAYDGTATNWGDDGTFKIMEDGTFTDGNSTLCRATIHKLRKPYGWIKNEM